MWGDSYNRGKNTGHNDGTIGGTLGAVDYNRNKQARDADNNAAVHREVQRRKEAQARKRRADEAAEQNSKVICTELHRQGLMTRADYHLGARFASEHLTERHYRGYHVWALPVVRHMRRSKRATAFWRKLAVARADHIAYLHGDTARRNRLGALLCTIGHPVCYALGGLVREQEWQLLYNGKTSRASK